MSTCLAKAGGDRSWGAEALAGASRDLSSLGNEPLHFQITLDADPAALADLLGHFAQCGLVPQRVRAELSGGWIAVSLVVAGPDDHQALTIAEKVRNSPLVVQVTLHRGMRLLAPLGERRA